MTSPAPNKYEHLEVPHVALLNYMWAVMTPGQLNEMGWLGHSKELKPKPDGLAPFSSQHPVSHVKFVIGTKILYGVKVVRMSGYVTFYSGGMFRTKRYTMIDYQTDLVVGDKVWASTADPLAALGVADG